MVGHTTDEGALPASQEVFMLNLGTGPGFLDADEELMDRFTLRSPDD